MDVSLSPDVLNQLNTPEARALHDISDDLSACGVGRIVNLPQIIVVGEQSSGKSSVLEAISHVRFPVEGGVCTRFATELVLRQADETRVDVSVKFSDQSKAPKAFQRTGFREHDLPDIIKEAKECMGFARAGQAFSKDILRLEIQGPRMYPLSLVDLPGLFHTRTETQSLEDKKIVDELVNSYMRQKNSIILVVISANNQLANHIALTTVQDIDPLGQRTIGVITKPDLTRTGSNDERTYIRVAKNQEGANKLQLGWHVLRNRAEDETISLEDRDENEVKFFNTGAWTSIPSNDRGIQSLRQKLSLILYNHVRNSLPGVIEDIEGKLRERQEQFDQLGVPRSTPAERRSFLLTIADKFQRLARDGIDGRYKDPFFGDIEDGAYKIRAQLRNFTRAFDHILKTKGSMQEIYSADEDEEEEEDIPEYLQNLLQQYHYDFPDPEFVTRKELNAQLQKQAAANQGREFPGSPNQDLAIQIFKEQAAPWKNIAEFHIGCVTLATKAFVDELFKHIVGPPETNSTTDAILSTCVDPFFEEKENLLREKLEELLRPYLEGYAAPLDNDFYHTLSRRSMDRFTTRFCNIMKDEYPEMFDKDSKKKLSPEMINRALSVHRELEAGEFGTDKVIDMMMVYYDMSRRTFTDNVVNLAIESCLVCHIPDILTPTTVDRMSDARLHDLAAESPDTISRRQTLKEEIDILRDGLARCQSRKPRAITGK
ncbi:P-loop containing nucleoside triphosphate hydrolase protein [Ilyonectria robusta]|uniref:P-loop containing nucleoside triphosphate hydrolase protein n=1 Tax=Ilyonectria robusta TaxID=1079257 RepID=UPI001E8CF7CE|nr:P-loop containing nucleoside triphosphate hydrolase protein [Ilyonectria robusta]KAH8736359.1 P-loop containing nucleoside triphosphate hydrolase protein [Ilyonectria robusta]